MNWPKSFANCILFACLILSAIASKGQTQSEISMSFNNSLETGNSHFTAQSFGTIAYADDRFGNPCSSLQFDGKTYLTLNSTPSVNSDYTCGAWVLPTGNSPWLTIACKGNTPIESESQPAFRLQLYNNGTNAVISGSTKATKKADPKSVSWTPNQWLHFAVTCKGGKFDFYINGKLVHSIDSGQGLQGNTSPLYIGRDIPGGDEFFIGKMDDFFFTNKHLTASAIKNMMLSKKPTAFSIVCPNREKFYLPPGTCQIIPNLKLPTIFPACASAEIVKARDKGNSPFYGPGEYQITYQLSGTNCSCNSTFEVIDTIRPRLVSKRNVEIANVDEIKNYQEVYSENCTVKKVKLISSKTYKRQPQSAHFRIYRATDIYGNISIDTVYFRIPSKPVLRDQSKPLVIEETVKTKNPYKYIHIRVYDNAHVDNDTISLFLTEQSILTNYMLLSHRAAKTIHGLELLAGTNSIVFQAINTGTTGGNTCTVEVYGSNRPYRHRKKDLIFKKVVNVKKGVDSGVNITQ